MDFNTTMAYINAYAESFSKATTVEEKIQIFHGFREFWKSTPEHSIFFQLALEKFHW